MIKEGESIRQPGIRRKPVLAALPTGVTVGDIQEQMRQILEQDNVVDVEAEAEKRPWARRVREWMQRHSSKS
jgi:hypothetical protein